MTESSFVYVVHTRDTFAANQFAKNARVNTEYTRPLCEMNTIHRQESLTNELDALRSIYDDEIRWTTDEHGR